MLNIPHVNKRAVKELFSTLERSFGRSGVFYIGVLDSLQHEQVAHFFQQALAQKGIVMDTFQLHRTSLQSLDRRLQRARAKKERVVLMFWSLEHLSQPELRQTLRDLCRGRERFSQSYAGESSVPVVLVVNRIVYQQYLGIYAMDLLDSVPSIFLEN